MAVFDLQKINIRRTKKELKQREGSRFKKNFDQFSVVKRSFRTATLIGRGRALAAIELLSEQLERNFMRV
jgi:hypothetical protein